MNQDLLKVLFKYFMNGAAIALVTNFLQSNSGRIDIRSILLIAVTGAAIFYILDIFAPSVADGARLGAGVGIGMRHVGAIPNIPITAAAIGSQI